MSDTANVIAARLIGHENLYAALRQASTGLGDGVEALLPEVLAALGDAPEATRLRSVDQGLLRCLMRAGAGLDPVPGAATVRDFLKSAQPAPLFLPEIATSSHMPLLTAGMPDMPAYSDRAFDDWFAARGAAYGLGPYGEKRSVYRAAQFADAASPERRMIHMGIDVFAPAGTTVYAPLPGRVASVSYNADRLDYGHTLILEHDAGAQRFWTLYGHLGGTLPGLCTKGDSIAPGQVIAHLGDWHENGGWGPHIHFQIMADMLQQHDGNFFGVGHESFWDVWQQICPDPNLILRLPESAFHL